MSNTTGHQARPPFPVGTATVSAIICCLGLIAFVCKDTQWNGHVVEALANDYKKTAGGEIWRPFTSWSVHADLTHLIWDVVYLCVVMALVEGETGAMKAVAIFCACAWAGSWMSTYLDRWYSGVLGSSAGAHGLLAYHCVRRSISGDQRLWYRMVCLSILAALGYLAIWGIVFGSMGWPFGAFANGGIDHLAGIAFAASWALLHNVCERRRGPATLVSQTTGGEG